MDRFYEKYHIRQLHSTAYDAAPNGLAEAFNKTLFKLLKKIVSNKKKD